MSCATGRQSCDGSSRNSRRYLRGKISGSSTFPLGSGNQDNLTASGSTSYNCGRATGNRDGTEKTNQSKLTIIYKVTPERFKIQKFLTKPSILIIIHRKVPYIWTCWMKWDRSVHWVLSLPLHESWTNDPGQMAVQWADSLCPWLHWPLESSASG